MDRNRCAALAALEEFCAWHASDFGHAPSYLAGFDDGASAELRAALPGLRKRAAGLPQLRRADVPLNSLTARLAAWRDQIIYGRGFVLLRRLPIERMADADIGLALAALSAHLGRTEPRPERLTGAECRIALGTGQADLTALLCLSEPDEGFLLKLASSVAVHNAMLAETPELLAQLYGGSTPAFSRRGKQLFARLRPEAAMGSSRAAKLHAAALARAEAAALIVDFEPGDVLFLNNHHVLFGLQGRGAPKRFGRDGQVLRLALGSGLVAARPLPDTMQSAQPQAPHASEAEDQAAA